MIVQSHLMMSLDNSILMFNLLPSNNGSKKHLVLMDMLHLPLKDKELVAAKVAIILLLLHLMYQSSFKELFPGSHKM